jgi:hypothetical protein
MKERNRPKRLFSSVLQFPGSVRSEQSNRYHTELLLEYRFTAKFNLTFDQGGVHHDYQRDRSVQGNCIAHH